MAIITNTIKRQVIEDIISDLRDSATNQYFVGIGRSEDWNDSDIAPTEVSCLREERDFRLSMQSIKTIADISLVIPRNNWSSGAIYSAYNDNVGGYPTQPYYVINDNNQVYIVIEAAKNTTGTTLTSTVQPTGNTSGTPFQTADGYIWKFLYSISAIDAAKFVSANFIPVKLQGATDLNSQAADIEQKAAQDAAVAGEITGYIIDSGGAGYSSAPTLTVTGNGTRAQGAATVSGGQVTKIELIDSSGAFTFGSGYDFAKVAITGGGSPTKPAKIRPILASVNGLGADPRNELKASSLMFNAKPDGIEGGDFIIGNDFRQVGLVKNVLDSANGSLFTGATGIALKKLALTGVGAGDNFTVDNTIKGNTSTVRAVIDKLDSANIWYHQTEETGFGNFDSGEGITEFGTDGLATGTTATLNATYAPYINPDFLNTSGEILYIDNRGSVTRSSTSTEDIKIVIQI